MMRATTGSDEGWHTVVSNGTHAVSSDTTPDKGGANLGLRPHELLAGALASCMQMTLRMLAQREGWPLREATVDVCLRREHGIVTFLYDVCLDGPLEDHQRARLLRAVEACPVRRSLSGELRFEAGRAYRSH